MCAQRDFQDVAHTAISAIQMLLEVLTAHKINIWLLCERNSVLITVRVSMCVTFPNIKSVIVVSWVCTCETAGKFGFCVSHLCIFHLQLSC